MKKQILCTALVLGLCGSLSFAAERRSDQPSESVTAQRQGGTTSEPSGTKSSVVRGEVLKIEGSAYVIKESSGREIRLPVDQDTRMEHTPKVGDKIVAQMAEDGRTRSIRKASAGMPESETR
ncbi:MAG: hypothetical protein C4293_09530 [Nitrospiraceae bacterium]